MSTSFRASSVSSIAMASAATSRSSPCATTKRSITSNSAAARPSMRTTMPSSMTSSGAGSSGPSAATRPSSGSGETSVSRWRSRFSRETKRRLRIGEEPSLRVGAGRLPYEARRSIGSVRLELRSPLLELRGRRSPRAERGVDGEQEIIRHGGKLGGALQACRERFPPGRAGDLGLAASSVSGVARISAPSMWPARSGVQRDVRQWHPARGRHEVRAAASPAGSRASDRSPCRQTLGLGHT